MLNFPTLSSSHKDVRFSPDLYPGQWTRTTCGMGRCEVPAGSESKVECEKQSQPEKLSLVGKLCHAIIEINGAKNKKFYED